MDCWAQTRDICLTLEEGPGGLSPIDSFIVLLSAREVVTRQQLRQTLVYKFLPAISGLQNKTNDTAKGGSPVFCRCCPKSPGIFVVAQQKICHYEAWALLASSPQPADCHSPLPIVALRGRRGSCWLHPLPTLPPAIRVMTKPVAATICAQFPRLRAACTYTCPLSLEVPFPAPHYFLRGIDCVCTLVQTCRSVC